MKYDETAKMILLNHQFFCENVHNQPQKLLKRSVKMEEIFILLTAQCGNCKQLSLTLFSQKFRESIGFTEEITKELI